VKHALTAPLDFLSRNPQGAVAQEGRSRHYAAARASPAA
jgi:hypothetical protein